MYLATLNREGYKPTVQLGRKGSFACNWAATMLKVLGSPNGKMRVNVGQYTGGLL
jgi:hypothetical protein